MSQRVFADLATWAAATDSELEEQLARLLGRAPANPERKRARQLFARAIETPGGLKVQTIHAFCERLLQRFPLEAGVPPGFTILDEETSHALLREAIDDTLALAIRDGSSKLGEALKTAVAFAAGDRFDEMLRKALAKRDWTELFSRRSFRGPDAFGEAEALYRKTLGVGANATLEAVDQALAAVLSEDEIRCGQRILARGSANDRKAAVRLGAVLVASSLSLRTAALAEFFLTGNGEPRKCLLTNGLKEAHPHLDSVFGRAQSRFVALQDERQRLMLIAATVSLLRLADTVLERYGVAKERRAALDFEDLIVRTRNLLHRSDAAQWVLYKLDGGLDHILVDEAQDTSPLQWHVIEGLALEFFAGAGAREGVRTLFAVGDEKQSIYSFQGAAPRMFAQTGRRFAELARAAGLGWRNVPLRLSFRTVPAVLQAIDRVFGDPLATPGLMADAATVRHQALREGQGGLVEIWPTETWQDGEPSDAWSPLTEASVRNPVVRLANRIADTIEHWLQMGERLASEDRQIRPGDILILMRKRQPFAAPMVAALKARGIPVAGSDRLRITEQIAVQDLVALGQFLTLPEDDLALAAVLKSPLFDLNDDDLLAVAPGRKGSLWSALLEVAKSSPRFRPAAETLKQWRSLADFTPPYEFFLSLLDKDGGRARLLSRLGPEGADAIDEFLNLTLEYDDSAPPSLQGFLTWLQAGRREIKRDMEHGRDEVRVMTVHGAKGLEAPVVFLPDTCSAPVQRSGRLLALAPKQCPIELPELYAWPVKGMSRLEAVQGAKLLADAEEREEHNRLLYVAMTRARDRLYVAGHEPKNGRAKGCWYDAIAAGLEGLATEVTAANGTSVRRFAIPQTAPHEEHRKETAERAEPRPLPEWACRPAQREAQLIMPLVPSRLAPFEIDEAGEPVEPDGVESAGQALPSPVVLAHASRFRRGMLTHALLEHLPSIDQRRWERAARNFVTKRAGGLSPSMQKSIVTEVLAVLADPNFSAIFGSESRAEVAIVAEIPFPRGGRPALRIVGQIDRLARTSQGILILDYKTNRPPPREPNNVAASYLYQLAAYRLAAKQIFAASNVRAAILWTDGPRIMEIPPTLLDEHEQRLWDVDIARLDA
jgi:ATP-dependent helicase/nuclease subunit A